jgi:hypothetical protein
MYGNALPKPYNVANIPKNKEILVMGMGIKRVLHRTQDKKIPDFFGKLEDGFR